MDTSSSDNIPRLGFPLPHAEIIRTVHPLISSQMAALGPVLYIPFGGRFKSQYMTAVFIGEALAALIPHILGIAEGVLLPSDCSQLDGVRSNTSCRDRCFTG